MRLRHVFFVLCLLLPWIPATGQEVFRGLVVDSLSLEALPAVSVQLRMAATGTLTNEQGGFEIRGTRADTLLFSRIGYRPLELPLTDYEAGLIRLSPQYTLLQAVTIDDVYGRKMYQGMFDEENAQRTFKKLPFWYSKDKKEDIKVSRLLNENLLVNTYVEVVIRDGELRKQLMEKHRLSEPDYYDLLRAFNETHHEVMYHLTRAELISLVNNFFDLHAR